MIAAGVNRSDIMQRRGAYPPPDSFWNVLLDFEAEYTYANGVRLIYKIDSPYVKFEGTEGWVRADYPNKLEVGPASVGKPTIEGTPGNDSTL